MRVKPTSVNPNTWSSSRQVEGRQWLRWKFPPLRRRIEGHKENDVTFFFTHVAVNTLRRMCDINKSCMNEITSMYAQSWINSENMSIGCEATGGGKTRYITAYFNRHACPPILMQQKKKLQINTWINTSINNVRIKNQEVIGLGRRISHSLTLQGRSCYRTHVICQTAYLGVHSILVPRKRQPW